MTKLWLSTAGKLVLNAQGQLCYNASCPCGVSPLCCPDAMWPTTLHATFSGPGSLASLVIPLFWTPEFAIYGPGAGFWIGSASNVNVGFGPLQTVTVQINAVTTTCQTFNSLNGAIQDSLQSCDPVLFMVSGTIGGQAFTITVTA